MRNSNQETVVRSQNKSKRKFTPELKMLERVCSNKLTERERNSRGFTYADFLILTSVS